MKKRIKKWTTLALTATLMMTSLSACSGKESGNGEKVNLAIMRTGFTLPLYYAVEQGYFEEAGLDVEVQYFDNGPQINEAIAAGDIDVAGIGEMPSITGAITNKSKVVAWMEDDEFSIQAYARNDSDIVKLGKGNVEGHENIYGNAETWRGKEVICAKGTSSHYGLLATLDALGLTEEDITITNMEGAQGATAFAAGTGDIFFGFDPQWSEFYADSDKYTCVSTCAAADRSLYTVLIASEAFCAEKEDAMVKFMEVLLRTEEEFRGDDSKYYDEMYNWQNFYGKCTKELAEYSASIKKLRSLEEQKAMFTENNGTSEVLESYGTVSDFMVKNGVIKESDKQTFYDNNSIAPSYMLKAIENIQK